MLHQKKNTHTHTLHLLCVNFTGITIVSISHLQSAVPCTAPSPVCPSGGPSLAAAVGVGAVASLRVAC